MERGQSTTLPLLRGENPINEAVFTEFYQQKITRTNEKTKQRRKIFAIGN